MALFLDVLCVAKVLFRLHVTSGRAMCWTLKSDLVDDITAEADFHFPIHRPHHVGHLVSTFYLLIIDSSSLPLLVSIDLGMLVFLVIVVARILYFFISFNLRKTFSTNMLTLGSLVFSYFRNLYFFIGIILWRTCCSDKLCTASLVWRCCRNFRFLSIFFSIILWSYFGIIRCLFFFSNTIPRKTYTAMLCTESLVWNCFRIIIILRKTCCSNTLILGSLVLICIRNLFFFRISLVLRKTCCSDTLIAGSLVLNSFRNLFFFISISSPE